MSRGKTAREIAEAAYEAYGKAVGNKNFQGNPMPEFHQLSRQQKDGWIDAVLEAIHLGRWYNKDRE